MSTIISKLESIVRPSVESLGFELWALEMVNLGKRRILRIFIDGPNGISSTDCSKVSRQVASVMDVEDPIKSAYTLEVSSPGMDRILKTQEHFKRYVGKEIKVRLHLPIDNKRTYKGVLEAFESDTLVLVTETGRMEFPYRSVEKANAVPSF